MLEDAAEPRQGRAAHLDGLAREDLELDGVVELEERIEQLKAEIARAERQLARKRAGREAADAIFKLNKD
jgi:uncharacterized small protein (DUF1192 family)